MGVLTETSISWLSGTSGMVLRRNLINTTDDCYLKPFILMHSLGEVQFTPKEKAGVNTVSVCAPLDGIDHWQLRFDILKVENLITIHRRTFK